jgi:CheY-like chemotaxis protein
MINYDGVPSIIFIRQLENGWYAGVAASENEYYHEVRRIRFILISLGIILAAMLSAILLKIIAEKQKSDVKGNEAEILKKDVSILEKILNSLDSIVYVSIPETGELVFVNDSLKKNYHIEGDCIGQFCYKILQKGMNERCDFCPCHQLDKDPGKILEWIEHSPLTKRTYRNTDCYIKWPSGATVHLQHSVDITELDDAKEQAIRANRTKTDFLARVSHEIRTPMNIILGIAEMQLEKKELPPDTIEALEKVYNSGYLLLNIINDILDLSKIEAGKLELAPVHYNVASLINDTVQLNLMRFDSKPIRFRLQTDENIPSTLFGDDLRIKQILSNILSNAFKYTDSGEVVLSVAAWVQGPKSPVTIIFRVSDTGCGMTQKQMDKLFDDYSRFNTEANRTIEGTGLGMGITKQLVNLMNGEITVTSEPGKGSVFTVRLPQGYVDSSVLGKETTEYLRQLHFGKISLPKKMTQITREYMPYGKVLIVDDMEPNLFVAKGLMAPYGLSIDTALNGYEAIDIIKEGGQFRITFRDHFMPKMDGIETTKNIRSLGYTRPIVALTANAVAGQAEMFMSNGFNGFISKPIDIRQLNSMLNKLIRDKHPIEMVNAARRLKESLELGNADEQPEPNNIRALVVDDYPTNLNAAAGMLRKFNIQADCILSGQEAVERIKSGKPAYNFILMDHLMPDMDGIETTRLIRALGTKYSKIPIIALTADDADEREVFLTNGFQEVITKPLSIGKLEVFINSEFFKNITSDTSNSEKGKEGMTIDIPGVDEKKVIDLYDGDMEIFLPVLRSYVSVIPETLDIMRAVSAKTLPKYTISVHGLKSTSESIGAEEARKRALELELMANAGDLPGVLAKNETLIKYVDGLLDNIRNWLTAIDATESR